jgi:chromosome segregation ATPase
MEVEQLLSWVRYERSRLTGFVALDEILTIVTEAKERVAAAEKQVTDYETKLEGLKEIESQADAQCQAKLDAFNQELAVRKADADANHDKALQERKAALEKINADVDEQQKSYEALVASVQFAEKQMVELAHTKVELESDVTALRKQLKDIKDSIQ